MSSSGSGIAEEAPTNRKIVADSDSGQIPILDSVRSEGVRSEAVAAHRIAEELRLGPRVGGAASEPKSTKTEPIHKKNRQMTREEMAELGIPVGINKTMSSEPCVCLERMEEGVEEVDDYGLCGI